MKTTPVQGSVATKVSPELIVQTASGFLAAKMLFVATELDVFEKLAAGQASIEELAELVCTPSSTLRIVCDAMVALGLLERRDGRYQNTALAAQYLSGKDPENDMRAFARFWNRISYPRWETLEAAVCSGHGVLGMNEFASAEEQRIFSEGVEGFTKPAARALASVYDFSVHKRIIDLGGGTGIFLMALADRYPDIELTLFELPAVAQVARRRLQDSVHAHRIGIVEANFLYDAIPDGYDAVILANVIHVLSEEANRTLMRHIRSHVDPGARALLVDFFMNRERTEPLFAALMSGEFLIYTGEGRSYSEDECRAWLADCGWRTLERRDLSGPSNLLIAEAI